ncbi:biotin--[acetyl-CoA-carboxylase] ligase [soil metagenome]
MTAKASGGVRVIHFETIDSTNAEAHRRAGAGERGPLWIIADRQTAGRGRLGRGWVSEPGNLYATHLFTIAATPAVATQVSFVAALAVCDMVAELLPPDSRVRPRLKWPNDVLLDGAKFSGLLPETVHAEAGRITLALGCGINLAHAPEGTLYPVTSLARHGVLITPGKAISPFSGVLLGWLKIWDEGRGFALIRAAWLERAAHLGSEMIAHRQNVEISGRFEGLAADGAMILTLSDGTSRMIHAGEVQVRPR